MLMDINWAYCADHFAYCSQYWIMTLYTYKANRLQLSCQLYLYWKNLPVQGDTYQDFNLFNFTETHDFYSFYKSVTSITKCKYIVQMAH